MSHLIHPDHNDLTEVGFQHNTNTEERFSNNSKIWMAILIISIFIISSDCYAQNFPLHGQLEVTDSISGFSGFNSSNLSNKLYDEMGVTIWRLQSEDIPHIDGLNFYAKREKENLSVMIQSDNESIALRGLLPTLADRENSLLCTSPDKGYYRYDKSKTLIYYLLQRGFEDLKGSSAIPSEASLAGNPFYRSRFSNGTFIFGYSLYFSNSDSSIIYYPGSHNWPPGITDIYVKFLINSSLGQSARYARYGMVSQSKSEEDSRLFCNDLPWLAGSEKNSMIYGSLPIPLSFGMQGIINAAKDNNSVIFAMVWAATDANDVQVSGRVKSLDKNQNTSSVTVEPDVLKRIDMIQSSIIWPSLAIYDLVPEDGARLSSKDVLFTWRTNRNSSSKLFYREVGEAGYRNETEIDGLLHKVLLNLKRNTSYEFYALSAASNDSDDSDRSEPRKIVINNGVVFTEKVKKLEIERDYDQKISISVKNTDTKPHLILVDAVNPYKDIYLGFVGNGSLNESFQIDPDDTKNLEFIVHAQDTMKNYYEVILRLNNTDEENTTDMALVGVSIRWPKFNISIAEIYEDKETLVKKFRVKNFGDTLTDFSITLDNSLKGRAYLYPSITHYDLIKDGSEEFFAIPLFGEKRSSAKGNMTATAADFKKDYPLRFECSEGRSLYKTRAVWPLYLIDLAGRYCTNNPDIKIPFTIPPGFNSSDVISAKIEMVFSLPSDPSSYRPHDVYLSINGKAVGSIMNSIPKAKHEFKLSSDILNYGNLSSADNVLEINTKHLPQSHYVVNSRLKIILCLKKIDRWICASNTEKASDILWGTPGIERNYPSLNVSILNPLDGEELTLGKPVLINVSVMGNDTGNASSGAQRHAEVRATFSNDDMKLVPLDDGMHGDGRANDGIYAYTWTPQISGKTTITARAANCRSDSEGSDNVTVLVTQPDLNITSLSYNLTNPVEGQPIEISFTVTNVGNGIAQNHTDTLSIDGVRVLNQSNETVPLKPGESRTWNYNYTEKAGNYTLRACSDSMDAINESNESNNCRDKPLRIWPRSDLNITSLSYNLTNPVEGQPIEIIFTVINLGNGPAQNHTDDLSIDGVLIKSFETGPLKPGESYTWNEHAQ